MAQKTDNRLKISIEYVGVIAIICLFAGAIIGWSIAPKGSPTPTLAAGDDSAAQATLQRIQQETDPTALIEMGNHAYEKRRADIAIPAYEKALTIKPDDANVLSDLATMYLSISRADKAIELNKKAVAIAPNHVQCRYNLGISYMSAGDSSAAKAVFEELIRRFPGSQEAREAAGKLKGLGSTSGG